MGRTKQATTKEAKNANGEDLLNVKVEQLAWLFDGTDIDWKLDAVDDGCPNKSGQIAEQIRKQSIYKDQIKVLFLEDALPSQVPPLNGSSCNARN